MIHRVAQPHLLWHSNPSGERLLWGRWILANALGELIGLGLVAAIAGGFVWAFGEPRTSLAVLFMTALMILLGQGKVW